MKLNKLFISMACALTFSASLQAVAQVEEGTAAATLFGSEATLLTIGATAAVVAAGVVVLDGSSDVVTFVPTPIEPVEPVEPVEPPTGTTSTGTTSTGSTSATGTSSTDGTSNTSATGSR